ncbi:flavin-dependent dehydrogenase [Chitinophaga niastensis]|uniref:Flavin-dependent dehydrogenase n=1 Tax=Chitinophaga niastensis TaxID=536980 RepID=A0A2P8H921_CHINA|nr:tryptophan 7-halogenase [Chitinophaga niastensis]PSL42691.1 flavin-dependent dehydrogenase [Chitinophaga niastensis]
MYHIPVLIAGGGAAGAATALSLGKRGIPCMIVETALQPQMKIGETIPPHITPLLQKLGLMELLQTQAHLPCYGNRFVWGQAMPVDKIFLFYIYREGWHLDRRSFEAQLHSRVTDAGIQYLQGWRFSDCRQDTGKWQITIKNAIGEEQYLHCDFMVDATGKKSRIAKMLGVSRHNTDRLTGVSVCYSGCTNVPQYTYIEAVQQGWWYAAPLSGSRLIVSYMTDADLLSPTMLRPADYLAAAKQTTLLKPLLIDSLISSTTATTVHTAATGYLQERYGHNWLAVGDAAFAYDPVSSYGISSALECGYYAGHAIADTLAGKKDALPAYDWLISQAFSAYKEMHRHQYQLEKRWQQEVFWKRRIS